ncbi:MAG: nucleoside recognition domain-containing protein [Oscillospiraceae bacterium]
MAGLTAVSDWLIPLLLAALALLALGRGSDPYEALAAGAAEGLQTLPRILPSLIALLTAASMLRASGAFELLARLLSPLLSRLGLPAELLPLMLLRPVSGSGGLALAGELIAQYGPDSAIGRTAAVLLGSSETTFYTIAVYFGAAGVKKTRYAVPAALVGDLAGALAAAWTVRLLF